MAHSSWGTGWPNCDRRNIVTLVRADGLRLPVHRHLVGLVSILLDLTEMAGYNVRPDWTWGYACRAIAGTSTPSNHSWGTAVDINAPVNPRRRPLTTDLPGQVRDLWKNHGFRWGGDYASSTPDPMHFEFMLSIADAVTIETRLRRFLANAGGAPAPVPPQRPRPFRPGPRPYPGRFQRGDEGRGVRVWQQVLRERGYTLAADGDFGKITDAAVRSWQRNHGLEVDGIAGPATWHSLLFA
jgi:hypothetical protein